MPLERLMFQLDLQLRQGDDWDMVARGDVSNGFRCSGILFEDPDMFIILRYMLRYRNVK